jgi:hypothetical protein
MRYSSLAPDAALPAEMVRFDYKLESMRFRGLPEIALVSPVKPMDLNFPARTLNRISMEDEVQKCRIILINMPMGPVPGIFTGLRKAVFFIDDSPHSLATAYSRIKRLSSGCRCFIIGAVYSEGEDAEPVMQSISKLQKTVFKHLPVGIELWTGKRESPCGRESRWRSWSRRFHLPQPAPLPIFARIS